MSDNNNKRSDKTKNKYFDNRSNALPTDGI